LNAQPLIPSFYSCDFTERYGVTLFETLNVHKHNNTGYVRHACTYVRQLWQLKTTKLLFIKLSRVHCVSLCNARVRHSLIFISWFRAGNKVFAWCYERSTPLPRYTVVVLLRVVYNGTKLRCLVTGMWTTWAAS